MRPIPPAAWKLFFSEFIGTALLLVGGLSFVIIDFGKGSPVPHWIPSEAARRAITGFLFGSCGALITISPVGFWSGAHINPSVTLAFWLKRTLPARVAAGYVVAQMLGAVVGCLPLLLWGGMGASAEFGATTPGPFGPWVAMAGEAVCTFCLVSLIYYFVGHEKLKRFTPATIPPLFCILVWLEAPLSGTSTNLARSFGPSVVAGVWTGWWVYAGGPLIGVGLAWLFQAGWPKTMEVGAAKMYHFEIDHFNLLHRRHR